ncbi:MAG: hypothetical protein AB1458_11035 [Bacteroidota bacterium]
MKFFRIALFTLIFAFAGFVLGYIVFAQYGGVFIPLEAIFWGTRISDMAVEASLMLKTKIVGSSVVFAAIGLIVVVLLERGGGRTKKSGTGFFECKYCGFKAKVRTAFCEACERDENGLTKEDYKRRAEEKLKK